MFGGTSPPVLGIQNQILKNIHEQMDYKLQKINSKFEIFGKCIENKADWRVKMKIISKIFPTICWVKITVFNQKWSLMGADLITNVKISDF